MTTTSVLGRLAAVALGAGAARTAYAALIQRPPGAGALEWNRKNHRGQVVTLVEGPAFVAGTAGAVLVMPGLPGRLRLAGTVATLSAGMIGAYDDLAGTDRVRGLRGHLEALRGGTLTSGGAKLVGISAAGLAAGFLVRDDRGHPGQLAEWLLAGAVVAGSANLVNLFDLRPGRAVKAALLAGGPQLCRGGPESLLVGPALGAAAALLPEDLGERAMLGDAGANALGALLGVAAASRASRRELFVRAAVVVALTVASEKVSFTGLIQATPPLRWIDELGRGR